MDAGLFGGTFNPLHLGHLGIAEYVKTHCGLDKVFLYPSAEPPHKSCKDLAPAHDRMKMVSDAAALRPGFFASDIELQRTGPSFTIDTIRAFQKAFGPGTRFHLLMGSDAFFDIATWKQTEQIFETVPVIVMIRGEKKAPASFASFIDEQVSKGYKLDTDNIFWHNTLQSIRICPVPRIDISSTQIRQRVKQGKSITGLVPEHIDRLIKTKDLYR